MSEKIGLQTNSAVLSPPSKGTRTPITAEHVDTGTTVLTYTWVNYTLKQVYKEIQGYNGS